MTKGDIKPFICNATCSCQPSKQALCDVLVQHMQWFFWLFSKASYQYLNIGV